MRVALVLIWLLTLAGAFTIGRSWSPGHADAGLLSSPSFAEALAARDELERAHRISAFLERMGPAELPDALRALEANNVGVTREEVRLFMLAWSRFDAPGAFAWARAWPTQWTETLSTQAIYAWGFRDARAALAALDSVDDPELEAKLRHSLVEGWLHGPDRVGASEYVAALSNPRQRGRLSFLLAAETMRDGPEAVMRWAESVPEAAPNAFKQGAFFQAATLVARTDPRRAAEWYEAHRAQPWSAGSLESIARRWAEYHDPPALFDWLRGLPDDGERADERDEAIAAGFRAWVQKEPGEAEAWLSAALPDPALDPAISELVRAQMQPAPAAALAWALRIDDEALRRSSALRVGSVWRRRDPEALEAWLGANELPAELREAIGAGGPAERAARLP